MENKFFELNLAFLSFLDKYEFTKFFEISMHAY